MKWKYALNSYLICFFLMLKNFTIHFLVNGFLIVIPFSIIFYSIIVKATPNQSWSTPQEIFLNDRWKKWIWTSDFFLACTAVSFQFQFHVKIQWLDVLQIIQAGWTRWLRTNLENEQKFHTLWFCYQDFVLRWNSFQSISILILYICDLHSNNHLGVWNNLSFELFHA